MLSVTGHPRCHTSTIVFESPGWLRSSRINDGGARSSRSFVGHSVTQGASIVLLGMSPIVEISDSVELCLALSVQHLKSGRQIALREGDWHVLNSEAPARVAPTGQTQGELA